MKKVVSFVISALTAAASFVMPAAAAPEKLPFELTPPRNVAITYQEGSDSANTCSVAWSKNNSMSAWSAKMADPETHDAAVEELNAAGFDDLWYTAQMDWSIDTQDDWHYNQYWDTDGYDAEHKQHLGDWAYTSFLEGADTVTEDWVFRYMGNISDPTDTTWYGNHDEWHDAPGWKDVLKEDQYEVVKDDDGSYAKIDLTKHTIYVRMRYLVTERFAGADDKTVASDWSEIAAVGKDAASSKVYKPGDVAAPVIHDLRMTDEEFNGQPVIAFTLDVPAELQKTLTDLGAARGGLSLITECRVKGTEEWKGMQGDWVVKAGEMKVTLLNLLEEGKTITKDTPVELRCRYCISQPGQDDFETDNSAVLTFGTNEIGTQSTPPPSDSSVSDTSQTPYQEKPPTPGSVWILWLLLILLIIIVIIVILILKRKKDQDKQSQGQK